MFSLFLNKGLHGRIMNQDPVTRSEFDLWVKMSSESMERIASCCEKLAITLEVQANEFQKTNVFLTEYTIENNHRHNGHIRATKALDKRVYDLEQKVDENTEQTKIIKVFKWAAAIIIVGGLTAIGSNTMKTYLNNQTSIVKTP